MFLFLKKQVKNYKAFSFFIALTKLSYRINRTGLEPVTYKTDEVCLTYDTVLFVIKRAIADKNVRDSNPPAFRHRPDEAFLIHGIFRYVAIRSKGRSGTGVLLKDLHLSLFFLIRPFPFDWLRCIPHLRHSDNLNVFTYRMSKNCFLVRPFDYAQGTLLSFCLMLNFYLLNLTQHFMRFIFYKSLCPD